MDLIERVLTVSFQEIFFINLQSNYLKPYIHYLGFYPTTFYYNDFKIVFKEHGYICLLAYCNIVK